MSQSNYRAGESSDHLPEPIELSEDELAEVSGGLDVTLSGAFFRRETNISSDTIALDNGSTLSSTSYTATTSIFAFQVVTSFKSAKDVSAFMVGLGEALKRRGFL